ncbi:unnamed protein product [Fusarium venenatum]|uniref:AB hydrolase-1 domain-containing protein n=1 Tax=Fusarium venenatum TaxID=56646 RepID=A0A2L2TPR4_9HYPO|nr:uncharacterized protein FVRRES_04353 [Fusarium venenatum]CEI67841.1 unnamed protein product [Fusarium venenatum]
MAGTLSWDYVFIRASIFFLHLIAPLSVTYSLVSMLVRLPFQLPRVLQAWLALEALFYLAVYLPLKEYRQKATKHPAPPCRDDRRKLFLKCHKNIPDPAQYLGKWFRNAPACEIKRDNIKDFFRWAFLNTGDRDPSHDEELEEYTQEVEKLLNKKLEPGRGNAKCLQLTLEKVEMLHRSLTWYLCVYVVDTLASISLRYHSFNFHCTSLSQFFAVFPLRPFTLFTPYVSPAKHLTYWHRPHTSKTRLPVLFIHGIGVGLYPYINFLADINGVINENPSDGQVGIIAIEIMSISSRITYQAMLKEQICNEIRRILTAHGWEKCVLVSHSRPSQTNEHLLSYFGSKDIGISHTLFRRFFWADNVLWKEDIQDRPATVVLAGRDCVIDTKTIRAYLLGLDKWALVTTDLMDRGRKDEGLDVIWFQDLDHGQVFDEKRTRSSLVKVIWNLCKQ